MKKTITPQKPTITHMLGKLSKNFMELFESGSKKEFQRLKDFITS